MTNSKEERKITLKEWQDVLAVMNRYSRDEGWVDNENLDKLTFFDSQPSTGGAYVTREDVQRYIAQYSAKKARVVMVPMPNKPKEPLEQFTGIIKRRDHVSYPHDLIFCQNETWNDDDWCRQQLSFVSDDEVKADDHFYEVVFSGKEFPAISKMIDPYYNKRVNIYSAKGDMGSYTCSRAFIKGKVIASDRQLIGLPSIPQAWIRYVYVPANGDIKQVLLKTVEESGDFTDSIESRMLHCIDHEVVILG